MIRDQPSKLDQHLREGRWAIVNRNDKLLFRVRSKRQARVIAKLWDSYRPVRVERYTRRKAFNIWN